MSQKNISEIYSQIKCNSLGVLRGGDPRRPHQVEAQFDNLIVSRVKARCEMPPLNQKLIGAMEESHTK